MNRDSPWIQVTQLQEVAQPPHPSCPISGWRSVTEDTYRSIAPSIPPVTSGMLHASLHIALWSQILYTIPYRLGVHVLSWPCSTYWWPGCLQGTGSWLHTDWMKWRSTPIILTTVMFIAGWSHPWNLGFLWCTFFWVAKEELLPFGRQHVNVQLGMYTDIWLSDAVYTTQLHYVYIHILSLLLTHCL